MNRAPVRGSVEKMSEKTVVSLDMINKNIASRSIKEDIKYLQKTDKRKKRERERYYFEFY